MSSVQFDDFEIGAVIGVGTVGTIYRVVRRSDGRDCALKLLSPAVSTDQQVVRRFEREMLILSKLHHPNIVGYLGDGKRDGQLFYVMELIRGGTLKEILQQHGPLPWREAAEWGRQIAAALQHAHNHGIIHRDLKPGNVFFSETGQAKLGDFGIARDLRAADLTDVGLTVGTYAYMAPESVRGTRELTGQVDLYALGCVLFEMLAGRPPYVGDHFAAIFAQHLTASPPHVGAYCAECPARFAALITQLLAKQPEERPFNARVVQGILNELIADVPREPPATRGGGRSAQSVQPIASNRRRDVHWATWGLVSLGVLAAITWLMRGRQ